jgi:hypothetical protein
MGGGLAFVERPEHLKAVPTGFEPIALSPLVDVAGNLRRPETWVSQEELESRGQENFERVRALTVRLDELFGDPETGIRPGRWNAYWLKLLYDELTLKAHIARAILASELPRAVAVFAQRREPPPGVVLSQYESVYADVLGCVASEVGVGVRRLPYGPHRGGENALVDTALRARRAAYGAWRAIRWSRERPGSGAGRILCLDFSYGVPSIAAALQERGFEIWVWPAGGRVHRLGGSAVGAAARAQPAAPATAWQDDRELAKLFQLDGLSIWPPAQRYLARVLRRDVYVGLQAHAAARPVLEMLQPSAVLMSIALEARERGICDAARRAGVVTIVSRHGELGMRDIPIAAFADLDIVDAALCWGEWEARLTRRYSGGRVATDVVGSPLIEAAAAAAPARERVRAQLKIGSDKRVVLYVPTGLSGNHWYASRRSPIDTIYFDHQVDVVRALLALDSWQTVIKEHPAIRESPIARWCQRFAPQRTVLVGGNFAELIHLADAVLLDIPSTTVPLALFGSAAVYVIDHPIAKWEPGVREHLAAHGVAFLEPGDIEARLRADDARGPRTYARESNAPLVADGPGTAASRAAEAIAAMVRR